MKSIEAKDSKGYIPAAGTSVHVIKDLKVMDVSETLKKGNVIKGFRLTADLREAECRKGKIQTVKKRDSLKKPDWIGGPVNQEPPITGFPFRWQ